MAIESFTVELRPALSPVLDKVNEACRRTTVLAKAARASTSLHASIKEQSFFAWKAAWRVQALFKRLDDDLGELLFEIEQVRAPSRKSPSMCTIQLVTATNYHPGYRGRLRQR